MIEVFYFPTPNGHKIPMFLEEARLEYKLTKVDILKGGQFKPDFLKISPNNKMPAIVDHKPADGGGPLAIFESGAILTYLAEKTGKFLPQNPRDRKTVFEWLFWQVGGLGPMAGQAGHFYNYAPVKIPYAMDRYHNETARLYKVLNTQLEKGEFVAGNEYSIADMAIYPWVYFHEKAKISLADYPLVKRWFNHVHSRPATQRAFEAANKI